MNSLPQFQLTGSDALRQVFRNHASGIAIVTGLDSAGKPVGFTATSVTSLGSNPPLASFNVAQGASFYSTLKPGSQVAIHTLAASSLALAQRMSGDREHRFTAEDWVSGPDGTPIFTEATGIMIAKIRNVFEVESNAVVVSDIILGEASEPAVPLLYFQRGYVAGGQRLTD